MSFLLGLDVGTTGVKTILIDYEGRIVASATFGVPLHTPHPLWSEQKPEDWWLASIRSIKKTIETANVNPERIQGIGLTGQMHGLVLLNSQNKVLRNAILWNDQRTGPQCEAITNKIGFEKLLELTGNPVLPGFTAPKILWVRQNEPDVYAEITRFLLPKDYIRFKLTGEFATDVSDASGTSLFHVANRKWCEPVFDALEIPKSWAPECFESLETTGKVNEKAAEQTGLAKGTPVVAGGGDQAAQAIGTGLYEPGSVSITLGTSGVVFAPTKKALIDAQGRLHSFCHAAFDTWHVMGVMLSAGGSFRWLKDTVCLLEKMTASNSKTNPYELMTRQAKQAPPGCEGLFFLPYLSGERTPYPDPNARGSFVGLTLRHGRAHLIRAVIEGICFGLRDCFELIQSLGITPEQIRVSGGGANSRLWRQILSDILNVRVTRVNHSQGAALGTAMMAGTGSGIYPSIGEACHRIIRITDSIEPRQKNRSVYEDSYALYRKLYPALKPFSDAITEKELRK